MADDLGRRCKALARDLVVNYFKGMGDGINTTGFQELILVQYDDEVLLEHVNSWLSILREAKAVIEQDIKAKVKEESNER